MARVFSALVAVFGAGVGGILERFMAGIALKPTTQMRLASTRTRLNYSPLFVFGVGFGALLK